MSVADLRDIVAGFLLSLFFGILAKWIAELLRVKLRTRYVIASMGALAFLLLAVPAIGPFVLYVLGTLLALGVILWWYQRAKARAFQEAHREPKLPEDIDA